MEMQQDLQKAMDVNVYANIHLYNLFMPLILAGAAKKVVVISSGLADSDLTVQYDLDVTALYSISKAAMNMATAKFSAQYRKDGVLFLSLCPGMVDVGRYDNGKYFLEKGGKREKCPNEWILHRVMSLAC